MHIKTYVRFTMLRSPYTLTSKDKKQRYYPNTEEQTILYPHASHRDSIDWLVPKHANSY
jgi:hypothetical protein